MGIRFAGYGSAGGDRRHGQADHSKGANATFFNHQSCGHWNRGGVKHVGRVVSFGAACESEFNSAFKLLRRVMSRSWWNTGRITSGITSLFMMRICGCGSPRPTSGKPLTIWMQPNTAKASWPSSSMSKRRWSRVRKPNGCQRGSRRTRQRRLAAFQKRVESAHGDLDAARTLNDAPGIADAQARIQVNEAAAAKAADELHAAEEFATVRAQLADAQAHLPEHRAQLGAVQDDVFASRQRLEVATQEVADAMHDRDEAMWCLYRNDIMTGRCDFDRCGFYIDLGVWGGHMPRDPEVVHVYFVHPAGYWVERPAEIQTRIIEVDRVPEIALRPRHAAVAPRRSASSRSKPPNDVSRRSAA